MLYISYWKHLKTFLRSYSYVLPLVVKLFWAIAFVLPISLTTEFPKLLYISGVPVPLKSKRHRGARATLTADSISEACGWMEAMFDPNTSIPLFRIPVISGIGM
ncbi:hypothetical protein DER44DRAFT_141487 [Fusarium oxysporum]|nr:hypothetical protein DER44DRAFT_141487 [Fusarium oxysporum]